MRDLGFIALDLVIAKQVIEPWRDKQTWRWHEEAHAMAGHVAGANDVAAVPGIAPNRHFRKQVQANYVSIGTSILIIGIVIKRIDPGSRRGDYRDEI